MKLVVRMVVMVVRAMSVMMTVAVVVVGKRLTKTNIYTPSLSNTTNNTTKHAINYS